jgi:ribosome-binding factor A
MPTHRSLRMAEAIREVVATTILFDVADPRVRSVTVLRVEVSSDLRSATVYVSIMGSEGERKQAFRGLVHAGGFLQARVAARLQTRFTPVLSFKHDDSVKKSVELARVIEDAIASDHRPDTNPEGADAEPPEEAGASSSPRGHPDLAQSPDSQEPRETARA